MFRLIGYFWAVVVVMATGQGAFCTPIQLIDGHTRGFYNRAIGVSLDLSDPHGLFPGADISTGDPTIVNAVEPDLSAASGILGAWLDSPGSLNANWSVAPEAIPRYWRANQETAIVYELDAGDAGLKDVVVQIGVDNGAFVWLDGDYLGGGMAPRHAVLGEITLGLGGLDSGKHYLQILREDHGNKTDFLILVTGETKDKEIVPDPDPGPVLIPEPTSMGLMGWGLGWLLGRGRRGVD
jgi:hypothetical protein